jgi:hypothetical protein
MTPEEFYWREKLSKDIDYVDNMFEIRVRSLSWVLDCYKRGTIRKRTILGIINKEDMNLLLTQLEELERYEDCITVKEIIDTIFN